MGEFKDDQFQGHWHNIDQRCVGNGQSVDYPVNAYGGSASSDPFVANNAIKDGTHGNPRYGTTTHGKQIGVTYLIKVL